MPRLATPLILALLSTLSFGYAESCTVFVAQDGEQDLPNWLDLPHQDSHSTLQSLHIPVIPDVSRTGSDLAVTVYFVEPEDRDAFLRALWVTAEEEVLLSLNLFEGVGGAHQRTVLLPRTLLQTQGVLILQASTDAQPVHAVRFQWLSDRVVAVSEEIAEPALQLGLDQAASRRDVAGVAYLPPAEGWELDVVRVALTHRIERIEHGTIFDFTLEQPPVQGRLSLRLAGADLSAPILVWVNGTYAGFLNIRVPTLTDEGYYEDTDGTAHYAGWREATVFLAGKHFQQGENRIQLGFPDPGTRPPAAKDLLLELRYPEAVPPAKLEDGSETLGPGPDFMLPVQEARPAFR